jgi:hypothetical protein
MLRIHQRHRRAASRFFRDFPRRFARTVVQWTAGVPLWNTVAVRRTSKFMGSFHKLRFMEREHRREMSNFEHLLGLNIGVLTSRYPPCGHNQRTRRNDTVILEIPMDWNDDSQIFGNFPPTLWHFPDVCQLSIQNMDVVQRSVIFHYHSK